jgi:hypothetical protein
MRVKTDTIDENSVRHLEIETDVKGDGLEGYRAAERAAKEWFFLNYDQHFKNLSSMYTTHDPEFRAMYNLHRPSESWFEARHPRIKSGGKVFGFGHHTGINPKTPDAPWDFHFEILNVVEPNGLPGRASRQRRNENCRSDQDSQTC